MKNNFIAIFTTIFVAVWFIFLPTTYAQAEDAPNSMAGTGNSTTKTTLEDPLGQNGDLDINEMIGGFLNTIMGVVGSIALLMFVYGGFTWMTAAGASDKVQKGKDIIIWATIGIFVIFASYGLVSFVLEAISGTSG